AATAGHRVDRTPGLDDGDAIGAVQLPDEGGGRVGEQELYAPGGECVAALLQPHLFLTAKAAPVVPGEAGGVGHGVIGRVQIHKAALGHLLQHGGKVPAEKGDVAGIEVPAHA